MWRRLFVLNEHLDVVLENDGATVIYMDGEPFHECMSVVLTLPADVAGDSMDAILAAARAESRADQPKPLAISAEEAFWKKKELPFLFGGGLKIVYDVAIYFMFRHIKPPEEK
jgi:hypothetical protein